MSRGGGRPCALLLAVLLAVLLGVVLGAAACGREPAAAAVAGDDWEEDAEPPAPTRDEILAAPAEHDADAVTEALGAVAETHDAAALPAVLRAAEDAREEVRWHAVLALKALGGDEARAVLARLAADDPSGLVRDEASAR